MSDNPDPVIGWVLGELRKAANEGISVTELSKLLDDSFIPDPDAKNATWKILMNRNDVRFADESKSPLQALSLTDLLGVGQGDVRIQLVQESGRQVAKPRGNLVTSIESDPHVVVGGMRKQPENGSSGRTEQQMDSPSQPAPRRRGRPPKPKKAAVTSSPLQSQEHPPATPTPVASTPRETRRQSQALIPSNQTTSQLGTTSIDCDTIVVKPIAENENEPTSDLEQVDTVKPTTPNATNALLGEASTPLNSEPALPIHPNILPDTANGDTPSISKSTLPIHETSSLDTTNGIARNDSPTDSVAASLPTLHSLPQVTAPLDQLNIRDTNPAESTPQLSSLEDHVEAAKLKTQRRSSSRFNAGELLPEATFTSQADMDWEDGKNGVYINPRGIKIKKAPGMKKKKHSTLVVFRSTKLKDPERLANGKDTWRERIMPIVAQARVAFDDDAVEEGLIPKLNKKRKADAQSDSIPKQKAAKKRAAGPDEADRSLAQGWGEAYPEDNYDSDYSGISILEADVPPEPANPNSWSSSWTREGAEQAKLNADQFGSYYEDRASSFTPSDSQTPWGSPAPPYFGDAVMSPTVEDSGISSTAQRASLPPFTDIITSASNGSRPNIFTPIKKPSISDMDLGTSPAVTYKSPYALLEREPSLSRLPANDQSRQPSVPLSQASKENIDGNAQLQNGTFPSFSSSTEQIITLPSSAARQLQSPFRSAQHVLALNSLQLGQNVSTYKSPYGAPPATRTASQAESPFVLGQQHPKLSSRSQQHRINEALSSSPVRPAVKNSVNEPKGLGGPISQSTEAPVVMMDATPDRGVVSPVDYATQTEEFLSFMDKNLSTTSSGTQGKSRGRGKSSARGAGRGRGIRRGVRGGARGGARTTSTTPFTTLPDQVTVQEQGFIDPALSSPATHDVQTPESSQAPANNVFLSGPPAQGPEKVNGNASGALARLRAAAMNGPYSVDPKVVFPGHALADQAPNVSMTDFGNAIPAIPGEPTDLSVVNSIGDLLDQTHGPGSDTGVDADFNMLGTQVTPSQPSTREPRSTKSKVKPAPKTPRARLDPEEKLRARIAEAEVVQVPDGATRLSCIYKELVGNMILSRDQTILEFYALTQHPPEMPMVCMKVSKIIGNPIMSVKGSFPMELHVKSSNDENKKKGYRFTYAASESGSAAAQSMRTKIVTAMIASEFMAGDYATVAEAQAAKVRPYLCELCGDRFKNSNGLEYHLTKARSKCNPNWDPGADTGKRPYRKKNHKKARATSREGTPRTPRKTAVARKEDTPEDDDGLAGSSTSEDEPVLIPRSARKVTVDRVYDSDGSEAPRSARPARKPKRVEDEDVDADGASDDSIFAWARNNSTTGYRAATTRRSASRDASQTPRPPRSARKAKSINVEEDADGESDTSLVAWFEKHGKIASKAPEAPKPAKTYKALHREAEVADRIVREFADRIRNGEEEIFGVAITPTSQLATANDIATDMTCKELNSEWYEEVVTNLVERNEGMFPAERSVWFASVAIWLKQQPITAVLPESKLCAKAVDDLVESKKFTRVEFDFKDRNRNPRAISRSILTTKGLDMTSERADLIKELVQETHPKSYVPSQLAPPPSVLEKLQAVVARLLPSLNVTADTQEEEEDTSPVPDFDDDSDEDDFDMDDEAAEVESLDSESNKDLDEEDDPVSALSGAKTSKKRDRASNGVLRRVRKAGHNAKISEGVRRRFDLIRAGGENPYPWNLKAKARNTLTATERVKRNEEKRMRDKELVATKQRCWDHAPAFMPNTETGAWDQTPVILQVARMTSGQSGSHSTRTRYARQQRLPEPITFMQAPDGAWSVRPFGHGVKPIHSRPARRAEGNPNLQKYLDRVENSHRPIIYPPIHNRVHLPAVPSIRLLEAMQSGRPIDEATGLPKVNRSGAKKRRASAVSYDDEDEPAPKRKRRGTSVRFAEADDTDEDTIPVKISRATGKPTRQYSRKFPKQVFVSNMNDPKISGEPTRILPSRKAGRKPKFSEVDILNFYEPKKLTGGAPDNPGLNTLPALFGLSGPNAEGNFDYMPDYSHLVFIAASPIDEDQEPGLSSWTVNRLDVYHPADYDFRWDDGTAFTVESLPYSDLKEDNGWISTYDTNPEVLDLNSDMEVEVLEEPRPKRQRKTPLQRKQARAEKYSYVRQHTALPQDFVDLFDDPAAAGKFFGVEIGVPNESTLKRSRNLGSNVMLPEMESRFSVACMVIRVLTGGLDLQVDWVLVAQMFPDYSLNFLKKFWNGILTRKKSAILKLEDDFRDKFLAAYQADEIPRIDYEHLTDYPWGDLVDWVMTNTNSSLSSKTILLPPTREEVAEEFELRETGDDGFPWRENYFSVTTAVYKRVMASSAVPHSIPLQPRKRRHVEDIDDFTVARSWVRVAAITPNDDWDTQLAKAKMSSFSKSMLANVLNSLVTQKVVKKRALNKAKNGRVYEIHDTWSVTLRRHMKEAQFVEAVTFKRWMDAQFRSGMQCIKADYFANEGTIVCLTSLQAHGRIRFHGPNIPMNKFGLGDGGYETKKIPRERLRINIDIYPTDTYIYDDANSVLSNIMFRDPPRGGESGEIPIWYGLTEKPIWRIWYRILAAVGQVVAFRSGITVQGLKESFKSTLEEWEWNLLLLWGSQMGLFHSLGEGLGASEGWTVGEWWWAVIGAGFIDVGGEVGGDGDGMGMDVLMS
ncbi:hypothetical protein BKA65DRAFT_601915 [Rhexocercosporidium sp. MPI-PUGE-AT-0058]|nr:hypothetical protein BKA65DRAFT_601915 [Rhexocercosporidium sp. MPI-PUGE-AT-0058]